MEDGQAAVRAARLGRLFLFIVLILYFETLSFCELMNHITLGQMLIRGFGVEYDVFSFY